MSKLTPEQDSTGGRKPKINKKSNILMILISKCFSICHQTFHPK
jgi:hypothetical protein